MPPEPGLSVRPGCPEEAALLARIEVASWRDAYAPFAAPGTFDRPGLIEETVAVWQRGFANPDGLRCLVVEDIAGTLGGFALIGRNRFPAEVPATAELRSLYLDPAWIGRGAGGLLFHAARRAIAAHGHDSMMLWCLPENSRARAFYARMGGTEVPGVRHRFRWLDQDWLDLAFLWTGL